MFFRDIPFKEKEKETLKRQVLENRIPHAQLFLGNEGSGALPLAMAFASYVLCTNKTADGDSCGECKSCKQSHNLVHPDWHWAFPVVKADGKNREDSVSDDFLAKWRIAISQHPFLNINEWSDTIEAGNSKPNINVKECQSIAHKLSLQAFGDGPKILILWLPEYLGKEGNRLLKLIEEPTPNTMIILVAENQQLILNTILSRCQLVKILPYHHDEIKYNLIQKFQITEDKAIQIATLAEGNISKAYEIAQGHEKNMAHAFVEWMRIAYKSDATEVLNWASQISAESKNDQIQFLQYGLHFLREILFWNLTGLKPNMSEKELPTAEKMKSFINPDQVATISETLEKLVLFINRNANMKINYTADTILIGDILRNIPYTSPKELNFVN